jgi:hypothetical protein
MVWFGRKIMNTSPNLQIEGLQFHCLIKQNGHMLYPAFPKKTRLCLARDCQHHSAPWMAATNSAFSPCPALSTDTEACNRATPDEPKGRNNSPTKNDMFHAEIL